MEMVLWKITVGSLLGSSSGMWAPLPMAAPRCPSPGSTSCTEDTANTLDGTTRAVTVAGMSLAYWGLRSMYT
ncbi:hypothetical protein C1Y40_03779 [Mycobacterium talmoniae]|uniref:Uncharacterized protein n=1 Tax=Mycobacterium talmoniae TaxID=1858794 RepID=A0A2S8BHA7_9MYCO|nr:hypothetical protein C1Y40_03779 [Mycobacterium talmoniae]